MASNPPQNKPPSESEEHSSSELLSSAKVVAEAAQSAFRNESDKVDKAKAADAAGDLLDAGSRYGKLDDTKGIGQYVDKAADYLHNYQQDSTTTPAPSADPSKTPAESESQGGSTDDPKPHSGGGGGLGGFAKLAGDFLKKP